MRINLRYDAVLIAIPVVMVAIAGWTITTPSRDLLTIAVGTLVLIGVVADALFRNPPG